MSKKDHSEHPEGFMLIVALGITAMMMIVGIRLVETQINTVNEIKMWNNLGHAKDMAMSGMEYLKYNMLTRENGFNQIINCGYGEYSDETDDIPYDVCEFFALMTKNEKDEQQNAKITFEIQGRAKENEKFVDGCIGTNKNSCYTVPLPGKGSAGDRCRAYNADLSDMALLVNNEGKIDPDGTTPQYDYSCNWNKLQFGSSMSDRVAIPLYHSDEENKITNPYNKDENNDWPPATDLVVRLRTPCLPCAKDGVKADFGRTRDCGKNTDETMCKDTERFVLDDKINEVVVQWQITGICEKKGGEEGQCGLIPYAIKNPNPKLPTDQTQSKITESMINQHDKVNTANGIMLKPISKGLDINTQPPLETPILEKNKKDLDRTPLLPLMKKPILSLLLNGKLLTDTDGFVPYLEYQVLTDYPIGLPETKLQATSSYNTNGYIETYHKKVKKELVDFVLHN